MTLVSVALDGRFCAKRGRCFVPVRTSSTRVMFYIFIVFLNRGNSICNLRQHRQRQPRNETAVCSTTKECPLGASVITTVNTPVCCLDLTLARVLTISEGSSIVSKVFRRTEPLRVEVCSMSPTEGGSMMPSCSVFSGSTPSCRA